MNIMAKAELLKVGITIGDVNGIGIEVIIKALHDNRVIQDFTPIVYGSSKVISYYKKALEIHDFNIHSIKAVDEAKPKKVNVVDCWNGDVKIELGKSTSIAGEHAMKSLDIATKDLASNKIDVLVTAPINKHNIQQDQFNFPGHTEYLAKMSNVEEALMTMVSNDLRIALATVHVPLKEVADKIKKDMLTDKIEEFMNSLIKDFGVRKPKIAVLGLNPHSGENGLLGMEEKEEIIPAIAASKEKGMLVYGPYSADGFFGASNFKNFDGILAMYHDQGLAPFKALSFDEGVNYTAGLPIVRTSPDHGTGYEISGKGIASETSLRNAIYLAKQIFENRKLYKEINSNVLEPQEAKE